MYVHSFSYPVNKLELGGYTYLQLKKKHTFFNFNIDLLERCEIG